MSTMKERAIVCSGEEVRGFLNGSRKEIRRLVKPQPPAGAHPYFVLCSTDRKEDGTWRWSDNASHLSKTVLRVRPPCSCGDRLWVRETFAKTQHGKPVYRADSRDASGLVWPSIAADPDGVQWTPSIAMPRWASRITLEVTSVRVERVQEITVNGAYSEGIQGGPWALMFAAWRTKWIAQHGRESWALNDSVFVIEGARVKP